MTSSDDSDIKLDADTFARRLRQAVHDKFHEDQLNDGVRHFWDASCLIYPVAGFQELPREYPRVRRVDQLNYLVGSLFSSGQLGAITMLPGHAVEFRNYVVRRLSAHSGQRRDELHHFIAEHGQQLGGLSEVLNNLNISTAPDDVTAALERLRDLDPSVFVLVESMAGDPTRRVRRWVGHEPPLIEFAPHPQGKDFSPSQDPFGRFLTFLDSRRSPAPGQDNNVVDATVLTALVAMLTNQEKPAPRFYTNTPALLRMYDRYRVVRDYFSFVAISPDGSRYIDSIWRSSEYYYLRSLFPALRLPAQDPVSNDMGSPTFPELADLSSQLSALLDDDRMDLERTVAAFRFESGLRLQDFVNTFSGVGMTHVWVNLELSGIARDIAGVSDPLSKLSSGDVRSALTRMWSPFEGFTSEVAELREAVDLTQALTSNVDALLGVGNSTPPEIILEDDLLAQRWALPVDAEFAQALLTRSGGQPNRAKLVRMLAFSELKNQPGRLASVLGVLYTFEQFDLVTALAGRYFKRLPGATKWDPQLRLIQLAADLRRLHKTGDRSATRGTLDRIEAFWRQSSAETRTQLSLGFGHCFLRQAVFEGGSSFVVDSVDSTTKARLDRTIEFIFRGLSSLRTRDLPRYGFAVNFVAYSSVLFDDVILDRDQLFLELAQLHAAVPRFERQYRFADTLIYRDMRDSIVKLRNKPAPDPDACLSLVSATNRLNSLTASTRSKTVQTHAAEGVEAAGLYGCTGLQKATSRSPAGRNR